MTNNEQWANEAQKQAERQARIQGANPSQKRIEDWVNEMRHQQQRLAALLSEQTSLLEKLTESHFDCSKACRDAQNATADLRDLIQRDPTEPDQT